MKGMEIDALMLEVSSRTRLSLVAGIDDPVSRSRTKTGRTVTGIGKATVLHG
jgi:hypothetical protein